MHASYDMFEMMTAGAQDVWGSCSAEPYTRKAGSSWQLPVALTIQTNCRPDEGASRAHGMATKHILQTCTYVYLRQAHDVLAASRSSRHACPTCAAGQHRPPVAPVLTDACTPLNRNLAFLPAIHGAVEQAWHPAAASSRPETRHA